MHLPAELLQSLTGLPGYDQQAFENVHAAGRQVTSIRLNQMKPATVSLLESPVPWCSTGYYLTDRPSFTFDPLFHAGCYYVQEASSMFLEQAFRQLVNADAPLRVLDLCGAPGGKSTHIQSLISAGSLLVSNEVIRSRATVLKSNIIKWGADNVVVTCNDPKDFSRLEHFFDVIVVDAPCSGSGLFRRDASAVEEWSEANVQLCSQRQQRILADIWPALKKGGLLVYSTCSYSADEDEQIADWLTGEFKATYQPLQLLRDWGIIDTGKGYRFWPYQVKGEGFFLACFRKEDGELLPPIRIKKKPETINRKEWPLLEPWIKMGQHQFIRHQQTVYAWLEELAGDMAYLLQETRVIYSGVLAGEMVRNKLLPDHAMAMSKLVSEKVPRLPLNLDQAIRFLQRKELQLETTTRGWHLVTYSGNPLGWVNVLANRLNNYYPKDLRILKDNM